MTFLAPGFFFASFGVAAAIVALHFIVTRQPRAAILPTARFVPDTPATTVARARRPSDLLLMLLRVVTVLAAGAALAKPVLTASRGAEARVILIDVSRSARDSIAIRDTVAAIYRNSDAVVLFDSSARVLAGNVSDTLKALAPTTKRGNLSAALISALRAGSSLRDRADSLELMIVSPFAKEELDAATETVRNLWPGKASLVRVDSPATDTASAASNVQFTAEANDPLRVTLALAGIKATGSGQRTTDNGQREAGNRQPATPVLVDWPASTRPRFAVQRAVKDTVGGVSSGNEQIVSTFERRWSFPSDSLRGAEIIARWVDGEPAAIEKPDGAGCVRSIAVPVTPVGDLVIRKDFVSFVTSLSGPCVAATSLIPADPTLIKQLEGKGGLAPRDAFEPLTDARSNLAPWLLVLALSAAIAEVFVRRRGNHASTLGAGKERPADEARAA